VSDRPRVPEADLAGVERPTGHRELLIPLIAASRVALVALALLGCARPAGIIVRPQHFAATLGEDGPAIRAVVTAFVLGEARGDESVDTLLAAGADFIATGVPVTERPRLPGMPGPGTGSVMALRTSVAGDYAWAVASYGWAGSNPSAGERGFATFVLQRLPAGWRVRHVHASHVERWGR